MDNTSVGAGGCHPLPETPEAGTPAPTQAARQKPLFSGQQLSGLCGSPTAAGQRSQAGAPHPTSPREGRAGGGHLAGGGEARTWTSTGQGC